VQGFGAEFVKEYIQKTGFDGAFNVGEFWTDLKCALFPLEQSTPPSDGVTPTFSMCWALHAQ
jgi:hypothetical protein